MAPLQVTDDWFPHILMMSRDKVRWRRVHVVLREEVVSVLIENCCMKQPDAIGCVVILHNRWCLVSLQNKDQTMGICSNKDWTLVIDSKVKC